MPITRMEKVHYRILSAQTGHNTPHQIRVPGLENFYYAEFYQVDDGLLSYSARMFDKSAERCICRWTARGTSCHAAIRYFGIITCTAGGPRLRGREPSPQAARQGVA